MDEPEALILVLKAARKKGRLSQKLLAKKLGVPQSHISKIESGKVNPTLASLVEIARVLGFELMAVPKQYAALVNSLSQTKNSEKQQPAYTLDDDDE